MAAKFTRRSRHETMQAAMDPGIPRIAAFMLTDSGKSKGAKRSLFIREL
jgi:hypothetical protein